MDSEIKELLKANLELSKENNEMLRKVRRVQKRAYAAKIAYWVIVLLLTLGAYYYIQPYIQKVTDFSNGLNKLIQSGNLNKTESNVAQQLLNNLGKVLSKVKK